jgi:hypothetical protein
VLDAVGLAVFVGIGVNKAFNAGTGPMVAICMGVLTGVGGGIIRDILAREVPMILRTEIYATACALFDELELDLRARPVRLVGVRAQSLAQPDLGLIGLWDDDNETWRKAEEAVDRVTSRFGPGWVTPATLMGKNGRVKDTRESGEPG